MKQRRQLIYHFFAAFVLLVFSSPVFAQWFPVDTLRANGNGTVVGGDCGFFFNELLGWIGSANDGGIHKTTDGGMTWVHEILPVGYTGRITEIFMKDPLQGWSTVEQPFSPPALFRTSDGGLTWLAAGPTGNFSSASTA